MTTMMPEYESDSLVYSTVWSICPGREHARILGEDECPQTIDQLIFLSLFIGEYLIY